MAILNRLGKMSIGYSPLGRYKKAECRPLHQRALGKAQDIGGDDAGDDDTDHRQGEG
jgi:hypothetical protein